MDTNYDIIYLSLFRWDGPYSSISEAMAKVLAKNNRVFYINHPYSYKDYFTEIPGDQYRERRARLRGGDNQYEEVHPKVISVIPPLTLPINFLPVGPLHRSLNQRNQGIILRAIKEVITRYNIKRFIYLNCFNPFFAPVLPKEYGAVMSIYQCIDDMAVSEYTIRHGVRLEEEAIRAADALTVTSRELYRLKSPLNPVAHIVHNAAETAIFQRAQTEALPCPPELTHLEGKVIGFVGNMDALRIDYPLLKKIAETHTDKTLVLVGPVNSPEIKNLGIDRLRNVVFTGPKPIEELAPYLQRFDCAIIPFLCNTLTKSIYPLKINEYLAAGRPVVSTSFSEDIQSFGEHIYLSDSHEAFLNNIQRAIAEDSIERREERLEVAQNNNWDARVEQIWEIINDFIQQKTTNVGQPV